VELHVARIQIVSSRDAKARRKLEREQERLQFLEPLQQQDAAEDRRYEQDPPWVPEEASSSSANKRRKRVNNQPLVYERPVEEDLALGVNLVGMEIILQNQIPSRLVSPNPYLQWENLEEENDEFKEEKIPDANINASGFEPLANWLEERSKFKKRSLRWVPFEFVMNLDEEFTMQILKHTGTYGTYDNIFSDCCDLDERLFRAYKLRKQLTKDSGTTRQLAVRYILYGRESSHASDMTSNESPEITKALNLLRVAYYWSSENFNHLTPKYFEAWIQEEKIHPKMI
jgi:hypothetical protein